MDTTLARALSAAIPSAGGPGWFIFVGALIAVLALSPKALDAWRRFKYEDRPGFERRATERKTQCDQLERIKELEDQLGEQAEKMEELHAMLTRELQALRNFIEEKFQQDRDSAQRERLALEDRITTHISNLMRFITPRSV